LVQPLAKVTLAKSRLNELEKQVNDFWKRKPFSVIKEIEEVTGNILYVLRINDAVPQRIATTAGENIHANRTALDLLVNQLIKSNGGEFSSDTGFPMYKYKKDLMPNVDRRLFGMSKQAQKQILGLRPYRRGNKKVLETSQSRHFR